MALDDIYKEVILDHYKSPRNKRELPGAELHVHENNPLCGDEITVFAHLEDGDSVQEVTFQGAGCSISQSSASMMTEAVTGRQLEDAKALATDFRGMMAGEVEPDEDAFGDLVALKGVVKYPIRIKCAVLAWDVLQEALEGAGDASGFPATHRRLNRAVSIAADPDALGFGVARSLKPSLDWLLVLVPVSIVLEVAGVEDLAIFAMSARAILPLAGLIGRSTEQLALHTGPRVGGLINATFGNVTELIIAIFLLLDGKPEIVKASLTGSILGNLLLVLGLSFFVGGLKHEEQEYNARSASVHATSLVLAVTGLLMPALFALGRPWSLPRARGRARAPWPPC